jgi:hypothetical protein
MQEDILQLWHYVTHLDEAAVIELIEEMSQKYPDPEQAELSFVSVWSYLVKGGTI